MTNTKTLTRKNIQTLSGGRTASIVEIDGEEIRLVASTRRAKTISATMLDDMIQLSVPEFISDEHIIRSARGLMSKIKNRQHHGDKAPSDQDLMDRALHLAKVWLGDQVEPSSVVWSDNQTTRWGSCTPSTKRIRISTMLRGMPQWVIDGVLVHELAHLKYPGHGKDFQDFTHRYPRMKEADAFLDGVSFAQHQIGKESPTHG
ncbi:M48 family metallopeptidase [Yaniella flava]|uniref:M48 family metallopeptidase n=1 Tax=Yaniella flava TaxID=287930 RepID=A0ABN2UQ40_9MICC|nr:M48 family metallopeptidase [Micrococcaceae bacterium]